MKASPLFDSITLLLLGVLDITLVLLDIQEGDLAQLLLGSESRWADRRARGRQRVDCSPGSELGVDDSEEDAGQEGGGAADVDGEHQVDLAGVLHLGLRRHQLC